MLKVLLLHFFVAGALAVQTSLGAAEPTNAPAKVAIRELLESKEQWKGKRIEVCGFYVTGVEVTALYQSEVDAKNVEDKKSLWIDYYDEIPAEKAKIKWIKRGFIRIVGTFDFRVDSGCGYFGQWPAKLRRIELVEPIPEPAKPEHKEAPK
jgi:hypothetical protein